MDMTGCTPNDIEAVKASGLFDPDWYADTYPDVRLVGLSPLEHYLWIGGRLGRSPSLAFDAKNYLARNPDVVAAGDNPLLHYLKHGLKEGREAFPHVVSQLPSLVEGKATKDLDTDAARSQLDSTRSRIGERRPQVAVIVPVYNAPAETDNCIRSILRYTPRATRIILIDDASPDPKVQAVLSQYVREPNVTVVRNDVNRGFTATVNRGIDMADKADVVLLNSDTEVTPRWIWNLQLAAYSADRVATATPFSNNAGAFSAPEIGKDNSLPAGIEIAEFGRLVARSSKRLYPSVPTGNGFCLYIRRECIDEIGKFDADAFPRGYGEENDFCMRAIRAGWTHVIDDATLIFHVRSASFGDEKNELIHKGRKVLSHRYPEYSSAVKSFLADSTCAEARRRIADIARNPPPAGVTRPRVLYVISTRTGGTPQTNEDLMSALAGVVEAFVLHCDSRRMTLFEFTDGKYVERGTHVLKEPLQAFPHRSAEYDAVVRTWFVYFSIELVHVRHIAWHSLGLIDEASWLGLPVVFSFHDFYTICPNVKLLDEELKHCAGRCTSSRGECQIDLWTNTGNPSLKHSAVYDWRRDFGEVLKKCAAFITTSASAKELLLHAFPFMETSNFIVIPHGRDFDRFEKSSAPLVESQPLRLLIPGNISEAKGGHVIADLAGRASDLGLEIHLLGKVARSIDLPEGVVQHGEYARGDFASLVQKIRPHLGGIFSIWPETYCHTLTELWASGIPVVAFDMGAVGERIRHSGGGWMLRHEDVDSLPDLLLAIKSDKEGFQKRLNEVWRWQDNERKCGTTNCMAQQYAEVYEMFASLPDLVPLEKP